MSLLKLGYINTQLQLHMHTRTHARTHTHTHTHTNKHANDMFVQLVYSICFRLDWSAARVIGCVCGQRRRGKHGAVGMDEGQVLSIPHLPRICVCDEWPCGMFPHAAHLHLRLAV